MALRAPSHASGLVADHFNSKRIQPTRCITVTRTTEFPTHGAVVNSSQIDVLVPNEPESSLVENVVDETMEDEPVEDQHHEDEIVENLDVIGVYFQSFCSSLLMRLQIPMLQPFRISVTLPIQFLCLSAPLTRPVIITHVAS